jgi:hypothetical protein
MTCNSCKVDLAGGPAFIRPVPGLEGAGGFKMYCWACCPPSDQHAWLTSDSGTQASEAAAKPGWEALQALVEAISEDSDNEGDGITCRHTAYREALDKLGEAGYL